MLHWRTLRVTVGVLLGSCLAGGRAWATTLEQAWEAAEAHSFELRLAREQTAQRKTLRFQALSQQLPSVITQWNYAIFADEIPVPDSFFQGLRDSLGVPPGTPPAGGDAQAEPLLLRQQQIWNGTVSLVQPLLRANAAPGWQAATRLWRAAQADERRATQQVRAGTARAFYALSTARDALAVSEATVEIARRQLDLATKQVGVGLAERRVLLQAQLGVSRAERDLLGARAQLVEAEEAFSRVTGLSGATALERPDHIAVPAELRMALNEAVNARPDVMAAEYRMGSAQRERLARDLEWAPQIDFAFSGLFDIAGTVFNPIGAQWRAAFQLNWTIFDGGLRIARSRELRSRMRSAEIVVEQTRRQVEEDVKVAWERFARAEQALEAVELEVALADENLLLAERGFGAGSVTFLEVEQARVSVQAAQLARINEHANRDLAAIDVLLATGQL